MQTLKLQLNTQPEITRELKVTLINEATAKEVTASPFLDGSINVRNLEAGAWRLKVNHPNLNFDVLDRRIQVLRDRPTFVPLQIPLDIFSTTPVRDVPDADLEPVRAKLADAIETAERQAKKKGGQPIYADDWNELSNVVSDIGSATVDLTKRIAPLGHDHPELVEKLDEIQANMNRFLDVFGKSIAMLQRQIQQIALERRIDDAIDNLPNIPDNVRVGMLDVVRGLDEVKDSDPYVYTKNLKRVGEQLTDKLEQLVPVDQPQVAAQVAAALEHTKAIARAAPSYSFDAEVQAQSKVDRVGGKSLFGAAIRAREV